MVRLKYSRKGYLKVVEAALAFVLTYFFVTIALSFYLPPSTRELEDPRPLRNVPEGDFRACVLESNISCINQSILEFNPSFYNEFDYRIRVFNSTGTDLIIDLPDRNVYTDSMFVAGNVSVYDPKIIKIYSWKK